MITACSEARASLKALQQVFFLRYLVQFEKNQSKIRVFINLESEVNLMIPEFLSDLGLFIRKTNIGTQKFDILALKTYGIAITEFFL